MEITFDAWSRLKEKDESGSTKYRHESTFTLSEDELVELVKAKWEFDYEYSLESNRNYEINVDKVVID